MPGSLEGYGSIDLASHELRILHQISQTVSCSLDLDVVLRQIIDLVTGVTGGDSCFVYLIDETRDFLMLRATSNPDSMTVGKVVMKVGEGLTGWVAREGLPVSIESNAPQDRRFKEIPGLHEDTFEAFLSVPIIAPNHRLVGVINVQHRNPHRHSERERTLLSIIGHQVGGAIDNANMYRKTERMARELQTINEKLRLIAFRDGLTDLYNHRYFQEALDRELARAARYLNPLSLILFDVDRFKQVNDTHGHLVGDSVLKAIAKRLVEGTRKTDMVSRYGGEEFGMLLPDTDVIGACEKAENCRAAIEATEVQSDDSTIIRVTASLGIAVYDPANPMSKGDLVGAADDALYQSKCEGRNRITVWSASSSSSEFATNRRRSR
ncbi:MAG TPA: sensor domain-containing diguanylate cyclase [Terriglobia bacterium]|nr:sensor domain-containing diguanylate cyclase [Terriglobia bacterium]